MKLIGSAVAGLALISCCAMANAQTATITVNGIVGARTFGENQTKLKSITTGDHHCASNCKGEPTRTPYRIDYTVSPTEFEIQDATVQCGGGTCGYSDSVNVQHTKTAAWATFDVWSRPTTWTLTVTVKPVKIAPGAVKKIDSFQVEKGKTFVVEHDPKKYLDIEIAAIIPDLGEVRMSPKSPTSPYFRLISSSTFGGKNVYTIQFAREH